MTTDITLVRLPGDRARLDVLRRSGDPRLILVEADCDPPITTEPCEDWIRVPADERDVIARQEGLRRRIVMPKDDQPVLDEAGLLRFAGQWVSIPPMEVRLLSKLIDGLGTVVPRDELADATWPDGAKGRNALDVHMLRLRRRVAQVGLAIRTVRARGYLLEFPS
jgi:DNA-binding response OmpR family regulator